MITRAGASSPVAQSTFAELAKRRTLCYRIGMCRNIKTLHNFSPPATDGEIRASALQFVRKISGFNRPSAANRAAFERAIERVTEASGELLASLVAHAPPHDRELEAAKARKRAALRFAKN